MEMAIYFISGFKEGQKSFGECLSIIVNSILLTLVYFVGVGLTSIFAKLFKKKFLIYKNSSQYSSYWEELNLSKNKLEEYYRQF